MDIDIIESTFNELMVELGKIKDLNEKAELYKERTQVLSDQLEQFLNVVTKERSTVLKNMDDIKALVIETEHKNANSISDTRSRIFEAINENRSSQEENKINIIERIDLLIPQVVQAKEFMEQLNVSFHDMQLKMDEFNRVIGGRISDQEISIKTRLEQNEEYLKKVLRIGYAHMGVTIVLFILLFLVLFFK